MAGKNILRRDTLCFYNLSSFQNLYFTTFTWVKKLSQYFYLYRSLFFLKKKQKCLYFYLSKECVYFCSLSWGVTQGDCGGWGKEHSLERTLSWWSRTQRCVLLAIHAGSQWSTCRWSQALSAGSLAEARITFYEQPFHCLQSKSTTMYVPFWSNTVAQRCFKLNSKISMLTCPQRQCRDV